MNTDLDSKDIGNCHDSLKLNESEDQSFLSCFYNQMKILGGEELDLRSNLEAL
jgi:hypothetical protein